jgi:hypothetical protein
MEFEFTASIDTKLVRIKLTLDVGDIGGYDIGVGQPEVFQPEMKGIQERRSIIGLSGTSDE